MKSPYVTIPLVVYTKLVLLNIIYFVVLYSHKASLYVVKAYFDC